MAGSLVPKLAQLSGLKREARRSARKLRGKAKGSSERLAMAQELRDWRAKYEKLRYRITGNKRGRVVGY